MCGISGIYSQKISKQERDVQLIKMLDKIKHRGPDNTGIWSDDFVSLGHQRLSIIDLSSFANQPFEYMGMEIIFNGEIYNYVELKKDLQKEGFKFTTESDTEVVMAAYKFWGDSCVSHFVGMWSFALWDSSNKRLFCSRDRFGIKPFYYIQHHDSLSFASEYKSLKELPFYDKSINYTQLKRGLALGWAVYEDESYYSQIKVLKPAHSLVIEANGEVKITRYWDISIDENKYKNLGSKDFAETFMEMFLESVKIHSRSDVTIGGCLSGGMDSSAIASSFCKEFPNVPYKTFTIFYEGDKNVDERAFANEVYLKYPQIHPHTFSPNYTEIADNYHNAMYHSDIPLMGASYISQYFLMRLAAQNGVVVILDGQGADEYLGGYMHIFQRILGQDFSKFQWLKMLNMLSNHARLHELNFSQILMLMLKSLYIGIHQENDIYLHEYNKYNSLFNQSSSSDAINLRNTGASKPNEMLYHSIFSTSLPTLLHYEDRNSMAFSIESRVPFLDHRLVEFAFNLPFNQKVNAKSETKSILRNGLKDVLPEKITNRHDKKGFVTPGEIEWLNGPLKFLFENINYANFDWLNTNEMKILFSEYKSGNMKNANLVWRLLATNYWLNNFN